MDGPREAYLMMVGYFGRERNLNLRRSLWRRVHKLAICPLRLYLQQNYCCHNDTMRRHISKEIKDLVVRMSLEHGLSDKNISTWLGLSERTVRRLRQTYRETGDTVRVPIQSGRPRILDGSQANVCVYLCVLLFRQYCGHDISMVALR